MEVICDDLDRLVLHLKKDLCFNLSITSEKLFGIYISQRND